MGLDGVESLCGSGIGGAFFPQFELQCLQAVFMCFSNANSSSFYSHFCLALKLLQWHTAVMSIPPMMWRMNLSGSLDSGVLLACNFVSA